MKEKYLVTTDNWFYAPDGRKYRAAWGEIKILQDDNFLGIKTNRNSTNWYAKVGNDVKGIIIAGCQIHYAVKCQNKPNDKNVKEQMYGTEGYSSFFRQTEIYIAE